MATFSEIFSTTSKVLLALVLIFILGLVFLGIIGGIGIALIGTTSTEGTKSTTSPEGTKSMTSTERTERLLAGDILFHEDEADAFRTTMPKSVWDNGIERAVKKHCYIPGMNEDEVARAMGEPTTVRRNKDIPCPWNLPDGKCWIWNLPGGKKHIAYFTPKGNVYMATGCRTLNDEFPYLLRDLFK